MWRHNCLRILAIFMDDNVKCIEEKRKDWYINNTDFFLSKKYHFSLKYF